MLQARGRSKLFPMLAAFALPAPATAQNRANNVHADRDGDVHYR